MVPTCWRWQFPVFNAAPELDPTKLAGAKRKATTEEFMAGGKPSKEDPWTPERFAKSFLIEEGKPMPWIIAKAAERGIKERPAKSLTEQAVSLGLAYIWPGKTGPNGTAKRYSTIPCPVVEAKA